MTDEMPKCMCKSCSQTLTNRVFVYGKVYDSNIIVKGRQTDKQTYDIGQGN